ncbi:MAG: hypothetical protein ACE5R4_07095 [Armatimonadota bacterium]
MAAVLAVVAVSATALACGATPARAQDPAADAAMEELVALLETAGLSSVEADWGQGSLRLSAQAPAYKDPMVALGVLGAVATRLMPHAAKLTLAVRDGNQPILELTTTPARFRAFVAARLSASQQLALEQALGRVYRQGGSAPSSQEGQVLTGASTTVRPALAKPPSEDRPAAGPRASARARADAPISPPPAPAGNGRPAEEPARGDQEGTLAELFEAAARRASELQGTLVDMGLENVRVTVRPGTVVVAYENRVFRNELTGLGAVLGAAAEVAPDDEQIVAVPKRRNVPVIAVIAEAEQMRRFMRGEAEPQELGDCLRVSQNVGRFLRPGPGDETTPQANRSRLRPDLTAEPHVTYRLGQTEDPFMADLLFQPGAEVQLGRGALAAVRGDILLDEGDARWGRAYLSRVLRPGQGRALLSTTFGQIAPRLRAWHGEGLFTSEDDRWRFGGSFTRVGEDLFDLDKGNHSRSLLGVVEYESQPLELTVRGSGGQFLFGDRGVRVDLVRRFGESEVSLTGIHSNLGNRWGINVRVPLGPGELPPPRCGRFRWAEDADISYNSTTLALGETMDYDFSLRAFRDELTGPYLLEHPEELHTAVPHLVQADVLPAGVSRRVSWERPSAPSGPPWPSLLGRSGLVFIPTADTLGDGQYAIGSSLIDRKHTVRMGLAANNTASVAPYVGVGFLPGVEVGMRYTIYPSLQDFDWDYATNRAPYAHVRLLRERQGGRPALAAFVEDPTSSDLERAYGAVVSKRAGSLQWTLGWGEGRFDGLFGGVSHSLGARARITGEYDSRFVNLGAAAHVGPVYVQGALLDFNGVAAGVSYWGEF